MVSQSKPYKSLRTFNTLTKNQFNHPLSIFTRKILYSVCS